MFKNTFQKQQFAILCIKLFMRVTLQDIYLFHL